MTFRAVIEEYKVIHLKANNKNFCYKLGVNWVEMIWEEKVTDVIR